MLGPQSVVLFWGHAYLEEVDHWGTPQRIPRFLDPCPFSDDGHHALLSDVLSAMMD